MPQIDIRITNEDGSTAVVSASFNYTYSEPIVSAVSPDRGPAGTTVVIDGSGFRQGATVVFDGVPAEVLSVTPTAITVIVPTLP